MFLCLILSNPLCLFLSLLVFKAVVLRRGPVVSCSAMSPVHQNLHLRGVSCVCCMLPTVMTESCLLSFQLSAMPLFACCGQALVPVLLLGQSGATWAWVELEQMFTRAAGALNCTLLYLCCPLRNFGWWTGFAFRPDVYSQPTAGNRAAPIWVVIFPSVPGKECLWSGACPCQGYLHTARLMATLWMGSGQGYIGGSQVFRRMWGRAQSVSKVCIDLLQEGTWNCFRKMPAAGLEGAILQGSTVVGHLCQQGPQMPVWEGTFSCPKLLLRLLCWRGQIGISMHGQGAFLAS